jgi:hypothetical protein
MVSNIKLFTFKLSGFSWHANKAQYSWLALSLIASPFLGVLTIPFAFILYIILSVTFNTAQS